MRSRPLLLTILLLIVIGGQSYATNPRKLGIGFRYGYYEDQTRFRGKGSGDSNTYISYSSDVNNKRYRQFPIYIQFNENLINNWSFTNWFLDYNQSSVYDSPPILSGTSYDSLIKLNTINGQTNDFSIKSNQTLIAIFSSNYPQYNSLIDSKSEPSMSADFDVQTVVAGKTWGVFIPLGNNHRLFTLGLGLGISYTIGEYRINICDPYIVAGGIISPTGPLLEEYREGKCSNKINLYKQNSSNFGLGGNGTVKLYSYIGESIEFNFFEADMYINQPTYESAESEASAAANEAEKNIDPAESAVLKPSSIMDPAFNYGYLNYASIVYRF